MKIFSVCARVDYNGQDVIDLGLFKSSNAALLAMKTFVKITPIGVELLWGFFLIFHHWIKIDVIWMNMRII